MSVSSELNLMVNLASCLGYSIKMLDHYILATPKCFVNKMNELSTPGQNPQLLVSEFLWISSMCIVSSDGHFDPAHVSVVRSSLSSSKSGKNCSS